MITRELTIDDFAPRRGAAFRLDMPNMPVELVLAEIQELPASGRKGGSFRLEFRGPLQPALPQGTYVFPIGDDRSPIFIVPIGLAEGAMRYEAIFY